MKALFTVVAMATIALAPVAGSQTMTQLPPRIITSGEGQTRVTPDRATLLIGVQTRALTASAAAADNAKRQKSIIDTLKAMGIPSEQIATQNYSVSPEMRYEPNNATPPKVIGYTVSNTVRVELKRVDMVGPAIDATLAKGANQIDGVQFSVSTLAEARRMAIADAVKSARADADALARAAGGTLGALLELSSSGPVYRPMMEQVQTMRAKTATATPIEPGEQTITANVSAIWQFVPGLIR